MEDPTEEVDVGILHRLLFEEIMLLERNRGCEFSGKCCSAVRELTFEILDDVLDIRIFLCKCNRNEAVTASELVIDMQYQHLGWTHL